MSLECKPATAEELERIRSWRYEGAYAAFNYAMQDNGWFDTFREDRIYTVEKDRRIVGVFFLIACGEGVWEYRILLHPRELGKGLGREITRAALIEARCLGIEELTLLVRVDHDVAHRLYRSVGFVETGKVRECIGGEPKLMRRMVKILA